MIYGGKNECINFAEKPTSYEILRKETLIKRIKEEEMTQRELVESEKMETLKQKKLEVWEQIKDTRVKVGVI